MGSSMWSRSYRGSSSISNRKRSLMRMPIIMNMTFHQSKIYKSKKIYSSSSIRVNRWFNKKNNKKMISLLENNKMTRDS